MGPRVFAKINEESKVKPFQTKPLQHKDFYDVSFVALVLRDRFLDGDWKIEVHKGSLTIKSKMHSDQVVKVFVDYENMLAAECGVSIHEDPVVVGFELTHLPAFVRELVRIELERRFHDLYVDPRLADKFKRWLQPKDSHKYDIVFLPRGYCEYEIDRQELEELCVSIEKVLQR